MIFRPKDSEIELVTVNAVVNMKSSTSKVTSSKRHTQQGQSPILPQDIPNADLDG